MSQARGPEPPLLRPPSDPDSPEAGAAPTWPWAPLPPWAEPRRSCQGLVERNDSELKIMVEHLHWPLSHFEKCLRGGNVPQSTRDPTYLCWAGEGAQMSSA